MTSLQRIKKLTFMNKIKLTYLIKRRAAAILLSVIFACLPVVASAQTTSNEVGIAGEWTECEPIQNPINAHSNSDAELKESIEYDISQNTSKSIEVSGTLDSQPDEYIVDSAELFNLDKKIHNLKENLMDLGYMQRDIVTDVYDPYTQLGVMYFQRNNNIPMTGIADEKTMEVASNQDAQPYELSKGTEGEDVIQLQNALQSLGYALNTTGIYDNTTIESVKKYALDHNIPLDGDSAGYSLLKQIYDDSTLNGDLSAIKQRKTQNSSNAQVEALIAVAREQLGKTYVLGGKGSEVFDCSGLVYYCLNQSGFDIEYMTSGDWASSSYKTIEGMDNLIRGDIVCFKGHVGIYLGDGLMLDASSSEGKIRITNDIRKTAYWQKTFICGKRVF